MYILAKRSQLKTATWAGGTTTQLAIHPTTAEYQKFNFDFRMSYATVEVEESTFTFMPGVTRHLVILKGSLEIDHIDRYKKQLNKFDTDVFSGEWPTKAKGKVMDFNLMTRGSAKGETEVVILDPHAEKELLFKGNDYTGIYMLKGKVQIPYSNENISLEEGDFVLFSEEKSEGISLKAGEHCEVIIAGVSMG